jgi:hypothetical protein
MAKDSAFAAPGFAPAGQAEQKKKGPGGQRKPLKRLDSAKRIQGNPSFFLCFSLLGLGWILLDSAKFGSGFGVRLEASGAPARRRLAKSRRLPPSSPPALKS